MGKRIWVLEDDPSCLFMYKDILDHRHTTRYFERINDIIGEFNSGSQDDPDLLLFDLKLPDGCVLDFLNTNDFDFLFRIPFIISSSIDDLDAIRFCLDEGAIDYFVKPVNKNQFLAKVENVLSQEKSVLMNYKRATTGIDKSLLDKLQVELTSTEYKMFQVFNENSGNLATQENLMEKVWEGQLVEKNTFNVHLYNLRKKLKSHGLEIKNTGHQTWSLLSLE